MPGKPGTRVKKKSSIGQKPGFGRIFQTSECSGRAEDWLADNSGRAYGFSSSTNHDSQTNAFLRACTPYPYGAQSVRHPPPSTTTTHETRFYSQKKLSRTIAGPMEQNCVAWGFPRGSGVRSMEPWNTSGKIRGHCQVRLGLFGPLPVEIDVLAFISRPSTCSGRHLTIVEPGRGDTRYARNIGHVKEPRQSPLHNA